MKKTILACLLGGALGTFGTVRTADANLAIAATFDASLSSSAIAVINQAITFYQAAFVDPITVDIQFHNMGSGLGASTTAIGTTAYSTYRSQLVGDATSAADTTAIATLPNTVNNPVTGSSNITLTLANARAVGFTTGSATFSAGSGCTGYVGDGCVGLNLVATNDTVLGATGQPNLLTVVEHEIDEVLGSSSALKGVTVPADPRTTDLFRYSAAGTRSFVTNASTSTPCGAGVGTAYFSIDGGTTIIDGYNNCNNGGDYGDWVTHTPTQVQDAFTNVSGSPVLTTLSAEAQLLDVIGYSFAAVNVPEPGALAIFGFGVAALRTMRRKRNIR